jgi:hypothetical protein
MPVQMHGGVAVTKTVEAGEPGSRVVDGNPLEQEQEDVIAEALPACW